MIDAEGRLVGFRTQPEAAGPLLLSAARVCAAGARRSRRPVLYRTAAVAAAGLALAGPDRMIWTLF